MCWLYSVCFIMEDETKEEKNELRSVSKEKKKQRKGKSKESRLRRRLVSEMQQWFRLFEKSVFSQNCRSSFGFDMAHPSSLPEAKSVSSGWKVFMFTMFKDANHSPASIFRLACLSVIRLPAVLKRNLEYTVDGWQLNSLTTLKSQGKV